MAEYPPFYDPAKIGTLFYPDAGSIAAAAEQAGLLPAEEDQLRVQLLLIDMQVDFCHPQGSLYVPGAQGDIRRVIEFLYRNAQRISHITCSLDSHYPIQIFHAVWWEGEDGTHPAPFTMISTDDLEKGVWRPAFEPEWSLEYVRRLQDRAKKQLTIWPYHVPMGAPGHALDPELWSAVFWHSVARRCQPTWWTKGSIPKTEHYSILRPEVPVPDEAQGGLSEAFVDVLRQSDYIFVAGEAESHCVMETVEDLYMVFRKNPHDLEKIIILQDCTSPVVHPDIDFHAIALERFREYEEVGIRFMNSTDKWPFDER